MSFPPYSSSRQIPLSVFGLQPQPQQPQNQNQNQNQQHQQQQHQQQPITYHFTPRANTSNNSNTNTHGNMIGSNHNNQNHTYNGTTTSASASASSSSSCSSVASSPVVTRPLTSYTNLGSPIVSSSQQQHVMILPIQPPILPITPTPLVVHNITNNNNHNDDKTTMKPPESIDTKVSSSKTTKTTTAAANTSSSTGIGTGSAVRPRSYSMGSAPIIATISHVSATTPMGWHNNNSNTCTSKSIYHKAFNIPSPPSAAFASSTSGYANRQRSMSHANANNSTSTSSSWTTSPTRSSAIRHSTSLLPSSSLEGSSIAETSFGLVNELAGSSSCNTNNNTSIDNNLLLPSLPLTPPPLSSEQSEEERHAVADATAKERQRVNLLELTEKNMSANELRHVLQQERSQLLSIVCEFVSFQVKTKSNQLQAKIAEESRVKTVMKQLNTVQAEKERIIIELEREEEMISNTLQRKLFEVQREKLVLEQKIERESHSNRNKSHSTTNATGSSNDDYYCQQQHEAFSFRSVSALDSPTTITADVPDDSTYGVPLVCTQTSFSNTTGGGGEGHSSGGLLQSDCTKSTKTISPKRMKTIITKELPASIMEQAVVQTVPHVPSLLVEDTHAKKETT